MMHDRRESPGSTRPPLPGPGLRRLVFALLVMCVAVLPHVTLAGSLAHSIRPTGTHHALSPEATPAASLQEAAPCHDEAKPRHPPSAGPACCIMGCGLIAEAPPAPQVRVPVSWSSAASRHVPLSQGLSTEPAERPPRPETGPT